MSTFTKVCNLLINNNEHTGSIAVQWPVSPPVVSALWLVVPSHVQLRGKIITLAEVPTCGSKYARTLPVHFVKQACRARWIQLEGLADR